MSWSERALCLGRDVNLYVLDDRSTEHYRPDHKRAARAAELCRGCAVIPECAARAMLTRDTGIVRGGEWLGVRAAPSAAVTARLAAAAGLVPA